MQCDCNHWVCYACMPEGFGYGYAASNIVATIVILNRQISWT